MQIDIIKLIESNLIAIVTFMIGLLPGLYVGIKSWLKYRNFVKVFGQSAKDHKNIAIIFPEWKVKKMSRDGTRFEKVLPDGTIEKYYGPDETVSYDDLKGGKEISHIFSEFLSEPIEYIYDTKDIADTEKKTLIMIGSPLANYRARIIYESVEEIQFDYVEKEETKDYPAGCANRDKIENKEYHSIDKWQYSVITRIPSSNSGDIFHFLVSGPHAEGTYVAGAYLREHWKGFKNAELTASVLLRSPNLKNQAEECYKFHKVIKRYGFPSK